LHFRLELVYDFFECFTVRLYHIGKVCWGFGFWFLVGLSTSKVNTVGGVGATSIGVIGFTAMFGIGIGDSSTIYSKGVPGTIKAINSGCGSEGSSSIGCSCVVVVVVAWIKICKGPL